MISRNHASRAKRNPIRAIWRVNLFSKPRVLEVTLTVHTRRLVSKSKQSLKIGEMRLGLSRADWWQLLAAAANYSEALVWPSLAQADILFAKGLQA